MRPKEQASRHGERDTHYAWLTCLEVGRLLKSAKLGKQGRDTILCSLLYARAAREFPRLAHDVGLGGNTSRPVPMC